MNQTQAIIERAFSEYRPALAYSGGGDSTVLLDIVAGMGYKPPLIYTDSQMEYQSGVPWAQKIAKKYKLDLHIAKASHTPPEQWRRQGYPMLGKMAARIWMQKHPQEQYGFKLDVSSCCQKMKIDPGRNKTKELGCNANLTGQRGGEDDRLRGMRAHKDGAIHFVKSAKLTVINPLLGWTDLMILRYTKNHNLPINPMRKKGALTIGCMFCGGGAQFTNSGFRVLRKVAPDEWRKMIIDYDFAPVIIAIKHECSLEIARAAIEKAGGVEHICNAMPHIFDFIRKKPLQGYSR